MIKARKIALLPAVALIAGFAAASASAYVPPSYFMLQNMTRNRAKVRGLRVRTRILGASVQLRETLWLDYKTRTLKARLFDAQDREIYAYEKKLNGDGAIGSQLLFGQGPETIAKILVERGVPVVLPEELAKAPTEEEKRALEKTRIGRVDGQVRGAYGNQVGWVIGTATPAFWVLKDDFAPMRLQVRARGDDYDLRFEETKTIHDFRYARAISLYRDKELVLKGEAIEVSVNPDLADMKMIAVQGVPVIPSSLDSATTALIEAWTQWIR